MGRKDEFTFVQMIEQFNYGFYRISPFCCDRLCAVIQFLQCDVSGSIPAYMFRIVALFIAVYSYAVWCTIQKTCKDSRSMLKRKIREIMLWILWDRCRKDVVYIILYMSCEILLQPRYILTRYWSIRWISNTPYNINSQ